MTILEQIIADVRVDLAKREAALPLDALKEKALARESAKDGVSALGRDDMVTVIAEVKRASPSKGPPTSRIRPDSPSTTRRAERVISVLTEERRFGGSLCGFRRRARK